MVSIMSSMSELNLPALMSFRSTSEAFSRSTGCPSRATFKIAKSFLQKRHAAHRQGHDERRAGEGRAGVKRAARLRQIVHEAHHDRSDESGQRADRRCDAKHAALLVLPRRHRHKGCQRWIAEACPYRDEKSDDIQQ